MGLDKELDIMEDGAVTDAEQVDEEVDIEQTIDFQESEEFDPDTDESDLEETYERFFAEEGPEGEGEVSPDGNDGGLASVVQEATGIDLSEEGFHVVDDEGDAVALTDEGGTNAEEAEEAVDEVPQAFSTAAADEDDDASAEDDEYEVVELEVTDDDIAYYLEDEDGNEIGFVLVEDGKETEYYYVDDDDDDDGSGTAAGGGAGGEGEFDLGLTKETVTEAAVNMNAIYKDGIAVATELKGAFDDIVSAFDFSDVVKKPGK